MRIHTFYCMYKITWQKTVNHKRQKDEQKISLHYTREEADTFLCKYCREIPRRPYPEVYYMPMSHPKFVTAIIITEENFLPI